MRVRLFTAVAISMACTPMLAESFPPTLAQPELFPLLQLVAGELLVGAVFGFMCRAYFFALQTLGNAAAMGMGFGGIPGSPVDDAEAVPAVTGLLTLAATALLFILDLHHEIIKGLLTSYEVSKPGEWFGPRISLLRLVDQTTAGFLVALRICAPFIVYSVVVNLAVGFANKLTPQIPAFFIATPFIMLGGLCALYYLAPEVLTLFMDGVRASIALN